MMNKKGISKNARGLIAGAVLAVASTAGQAQVAIPVVGNLGLLSSLDVLESLELGGGIPVLGDLLGGDLLGGGIPVLGDLLGGDLLGGGVPVVGGLLGGGLPGLDLAGALTPNVDVVALQTLLSPAAIGDPTAYLTALDAVLAIVQSPSAVVPVPLAPPLLRGFVPGFFVLYEAPQNLLSFLTSGGSIVDPSLVAVPAIPLLSAPLPLALPLGELPALPLGDLGLLAPVDIVNLVLSSIP